MKSVVEKWLTRQMLGEVFGNLAVGMLTALLAVPLALLHCFLLWMVIRLFMGGNPLAEVFGRGPLVVDGAIVIAMVLFAGWFVAYLIWERRREERSKWTEKKEDDPSVLDVTLVMVQILFAAPAVVMMAASFLGNAGVWAKMDVKGCAAVLTKVLGSPHRVAIETLRRELPGVDWDKVEKQLRLIPGVVFLASAPAGISVTGELRQTLTKQRWEGDWEPPPKDERVEFVCGKCGQKLRIRRFQSNYAIRCPQCQARYRGRLDLHGRLRIEPEPERKRQAPPVKEAVGELAGHYRTLGLPVNADLVALRRAYRRMMKQHHPDLYAMADAPKRAQVEEKAKLINEAYHALLDHLEGREN